MDISSLLVLPHPPEFLSPSDDLEAPLQQVQQDMKSLLKQNISPETETILVLQAMGGIYPDALCFHVPEKNVYQSIDGQYVFDSELAHHIQKSFLEYEKAHHLLDQTELSFPVEIITNLLLSLELPIPKLVVVGVSLQSFKEQYEYGSLIARALRSDSASTSVVVSGQLSHTLTKESAAGYVPEARKFDSDFVKNAVAGSLSALEHTDQIILQEVGQDLFRPFAMGLGVLDAHQHGFTLDESQYREAMGIGMLSGLLKRKSQS